MPHTNGDEMTKTLFKAAAAAAIAIAAVAATAQPATNAAPANVGVSQSTAAEAASKAVPRSDTGTLVRTGPTAGDRAGTAVDRTRSSMGTSNDAAATGTATTGTATAGMATTAPPQRARKADRN